MWERQRLSTQIKRKIKTLQKAADKEKQANNEQGGSTTTTTTATVCQQFILLLVLGTNEIRSFGLSS